MYIEAWIFWGIIIVAVCAIVSLIIKNNKAKVIIEELTRTYDETVCRLITYSWSKASEKNKKEFLSAFAGAVVDGAEHSVTTRSLLDTTDIISMCRIFKSFTMREQLTQPDIFKKEDQDTTKILNETVQNDLNNFLDTKNN